MLLLKLCMVVIHLSLPLALLEQVPVGLCKD